MDSDTPKGNDDSDAESSDAVCNTERKKSSLSVKDTGVILILSTLLSVGLVAGALGMEGIKRKFDTNDVWDLVMVTTFFVALFTLVTFLLVKFAAHYLIYLAVGTFLAIVFPVSPSRQRSTLKEIYSKVEKRS